MQKTLKIGRNKRKGVAIPRIWIEGAALANNGWKRGRDFVAVHVKHADGSGSIEYRSIMSIPGGINSSAEVRHVAGTDDRPIIDTCTPKILETLGADATHAKITITEEKIVIEKGEAPPKKGAAAALIACLIAVGTVAAPYVSQFKRGAQRVLVACEESATVRDQFTLLGHDAVSCDILDTRNPYGWHIKGDVTPWLDQDWDLVLAFPPCTYLTISAAYAFKDPDFDRYPGVGYHQRLKPGTLFGEDRRRARDEAIEFVDLIWRKSKRAVIENPKGFLSTMWRKPSQMVHPFWFGDPESKETCLWLKEVDEIEPTDMLRVEDHGYLVESGPHAGKWRWPNQSPCGAPKMGPRDDRAKLKSTTYPGFARALAIQLGGKVA